MTHDYPENIVEYMADFTRGDRRELRVIRSGSVHRVGGQSAKEKSKVFFERLAALIVTLISIGLFIALTGAGDAKRGLVSDCIEKAAAAQHYQGTDAGKWSTFEAGCQI